MPGVAECSHDGNRDHAIARRPTAATSELREASPMHRVDLGSTRTPDMTSAWLARRWYYTPKSRRAYSVRQVSPGDRRLLAEFVLELNAIAPERDRSALQGLTSLLFDRVIVGTGDGALAFAALE